MDTVINKVFEYFDSIFFEEKAEILQDGNMGFHYDGLNFDKYLWDSALDLEYISIEDYFEATAKVQYNETESLFLQYSNLEIEHKLSVISAILTLTYRSTYKNSQTVEIIKRTTAYMQRYGFQINQDYNNIAVLSEYKMFEGSYCEILKYDSQFYKKRLKPQFLLEEQWRKRFKYEYENMEKLSGSPHVLKVFNFDEHENSYLMEQCDSNLFEFLENSPFITDENLIGMIYELINGMIEVHDCGVIHRDLHLGNILVKGEYLILSDFGLSKDTMRTHSLKSSSTPKNSHYFMDPIGLTDFTKLDKQSDIYSVGKIIDYITRNSELNSKLSYIVNKSTDRDKKRRYGNFDEFLSDLEASLNDISEEEKARLIENKIQKAINSPEVESFIIDSAKRKYLSNYIVNMKLYNFWRLLLEFQDSNQELILSSIRDTYAEATGFGQFENYDLFSIIMKNYIYETTNSKFRHIAYVILNGCAKYRYKSAEYLKEINIKYPALKNFTA